MVAKALLVLCASALVAQSAAQCWGRHAIAGPYHAGGWGCGGYGADIAAASSLNAACGGVLGVSTGSCASPTGINVASENVYEGPLAVAGNLPFLGTVGLEGVFPSAGTGGVSYGCGEGALGITAEGTGFGGLGYAGLGYNGLGYGGLGYDGLGYNGLGYRGIAGRGCGCGY